MKYIWTPFLGLILSGCGTIPQADPEAVSNFVPHELDEGDDMGVYLIRPNQIAGSGRDYWVASDNEVIGDLENGSYVFLSLNSKENLSMNTVVSMAGQNYIGLPPINGKSEYYFYTVDFTSWIPNKVTPGVGKTLASGLERHPLDYKVRPNDGFDNLAMNPSMVETYMVQRSEMGKGKIRISPNQDHGVVYFFRPSSTEKAMSLPASVWLKDEHLGALEAKQYFAVKMPVGKHNLYRRDGKYHCLSIDVQADKYHYVELEQSFSFTGYNHGLTFVGSEKSVTNDKVNGWMESLTEYTPIPKEEWSDRQSSHVERGLFYLQQNMPLFSEKN